MKTIKRIAPGSLAKILGLMYAVVGLLIGLFVLLVSIFASSSEVKEMDFVFLGTAAPIVLPLAYGIMGWISGYIGAWIYNFVAKNMGGVQVEVE